MSYLDQIEAVRQGYLERLDSANAEKRGEYHKSCAEFLIQVPASSSLLGNLFRFDIAGVQDGNVKISDANGNADDLTFTMEGLSGTPITFKAFSWNCAIFRIPGLVVPLMELETWFKRWIGPGHRADRVPRSIQEMNAWFEGWDETGAEHQGFIHGVSRTGDDEITVDFGTASLSAFDELLLTLESAGAPELEISAGTTAPLFDEVVGILQQGSPAAAAQDPVPERAPPQHADIASDAAEPASERDAPPAEAPEASRTEQQKVEGAETFFSWFSENGVRLAAAADRSAEDEAAEIESAEGEATESKAAKTAGSSFAAVEAEILEELAKVDDGLGCEVRPGEQRRFALVFSPKRQAALVPIALGLVKQAPDLTDWEFQAFRPARPLDRPIEVSIPVDGTMGEDSQSLHIDPKTVQVSLQPKVCRLDFVLYLDDLEPGTEGRIGHAGPQILEALLGERGYVEGVASVSVKPYPDETAEAIALPQAASQFAKHSASLRMAFRKLKGAPAETAVAACLEPLTDDLDQLEEALSKYGRYEQIKLSLTFWGDSRELKAQVESAFPGFEIWATPALSLVGEGVEIEAEGACPAASVDLRRWLTDRVTALYDQGLVLIRLGEQEIAPLGMEQLIDSRATALMSEGQWAEAATLLRPLIDRIGEAEEGRIHAKAGLCYLRAGHAQPAIPLLEQALEMTRDTALMGQVHNYLGIALQEAGAIEDAYLQFQKAVALGPTVGARHYNLGQYYALLGDPDQASKHLSQAIQHDPDLLQLLLEDEDLEPFRKTSWFKKLKKKGPRGQKSKKKTKDSGKPARKARQARPEGQSKSAFGRIFGKLKKSA